MTSAPSPSDLWAKLRYQNNDRSTGVITGWHPLVAHSADVAAVTDALLTRTILRKRLARLLGWDDLTEAHIARLCVFAALHDAGKCNVGFQNRAHDATPTAGHVGPMIYAFRADDPLRLIEPLQIPHMAPWFESERMLEHMLLATWGHHGKPVRVQSVASYASYWQETERVNPLDGLARLGTAVRAWFPTAFDTALPFPETNAFQHAFNGVLTLADWIGSDTDFFPFADTTDPDALIDRARAKAADAIRQLFLDADTTRTALKATVGFDAILEGDWQPYPIQQAVRDQALHPSGSLTVLESDTGSGKTEAALARFIRLFQAGLVDGMYFAVPTRSAATQLHTRITNAARRIFPDEVRPTVVQAVPGYIKADDTVGRPLKGFEVRWDEPMKGRGWAAESPKRYLAAPIAVGTVDQVLLSSLQVKHAHMRSAALLRQFLVVDEVHASDVYMTAVMDRVLQHHLRAGGHALLMSATLGAAARTHLTTGGQDDVADPETAEANPYPLVTHVDASRTDPDTTHAASSGQQKTVRLDLRPIAGDPAAIAHDALDAARDGAHVLIIRNRVADCQAVQHALEDAAGPESPLLFRLNGTPAPHHSRFAPDDRRALDRRIETLFGTGARALDHGVVVVATQTVEQSLDIDADLLLTDLCPMDVLLQRIGRLHRHTRMRPKGYDTAPCVVLTPDERDLSAHITIGGPNNGKAFGPHGLGTVYTDLRMLEAAWRVLDACSTVDIPKDNRRLVERATHPERLQAIVEEGGEAWIAHQKYIFGEAYADRSLWEIVGVHRDAPFADDGFPDDIGAIKTRLGQEDHRVRLPKPLPGPFAASIDELTLPEWMLEEMPETEEATNATACEGGFRFTFGGQTFRYDRRGVVQHE